MPAEMDWDRIIYSTAQPDEDLSGQIDALLEYQENWPLFREGEAALSGMQTRIIPEGHAQIVVQANPGRRKSTHAKTDPASISRRPCFLCPENIPPEERGIAFGDLVILPNPYPVLRRHFTIPAREHTPQRLEGRVADMLGLVRALGPDMLVFYNGPGCGASAPDHFHFQACANSGIPLLTHLPGGGEDGRLALTSFGRRLLVCSEKGAGNTADFVSRVLKSLPPEDPEPLINVLAVYRDERYLTVLWPRSKHRPACYFKQGDAQIAVSPAALEMAGILVVADPDHFDRVDQQAAVSIYREVSLDAEEFDQLAKAVT
jgi:hypothetical protein